MWRKLSSSRPSDRRVKCGLQPTRKLRCASRSSGCRVAAGTDRIASHGRLGGAHRRRPGCRCAGRGRRLSSPGARLRPRDGPAGEDLSYLCWRAGPFRRSHSPRSSPSARCGHPAVDGLAHPPAAIGRDADGPEDRLPRTLPVVRPRLQEHFTRLEQELRSLHSDLHQALRNSPVCLARRSFCAACLVSAPLLPHPVRTAGVAYPLPQTIAALVGVAPLYRTAATPRPTPFLWLSRRGAPRLAYGYLGRHTLPCDHPSFYQRLLPPASPARWPSPHACAVLSSRMR